MERWSMAFKKQSCLNRFFYKFDDKFNIVMHFGWLYDFKASRLYFKLLKRISKCDGVL